MRDGYFDDSPVLDRGPIFESEFLSIEALERGGGTMSRRVRRVEYEHVEDEPNAVRFHDFTERAGVHLVATPDPRVVLLVSTTHPIVEDV